jgi:alpha-ribazole phosphatase/probable phosphoglycerate mutase
MSTDYDVQIEPLESPLEPTVLSLGTECSTRLMLIRHGHIAANSGELNAPMAGWTDVPLSARGRLEVKQLTQHLRRGPQFDAIYSSPLSRASDTARLLVAAGLGPFRLFPPLKEINCGEVDGLALGEVKRRLPLLWRENCRQEREELRWPGGESYREFRNRCVGAMHSIVAAHPSGRVAVVTHAGVISQILGSIAGVSPARWALFRPGNASVTELVWRGSSGVVVSFDCRTHLSDAS